MSFSLCSRCLQRSLLSPNTAPNIIPPPSVAAPFSTSTPNSAKAAARKVVAAKPGGRSLRLAKNIRANTSRPPAPGERKALRKRIVLSNTNALEVPGLEDFTTGLVNGGKVGEMNGQMLGLGDDTVDMLRALEAFKPTQGWSLFRRPATLVRNCTTELASSINQAQNDKQVERRVLFGPRSSGKSVLLLQALTMAYLKGWVVIHFPEAREMTMAQTSYRPHTTPEGETIYIQPHYTAHLLSNIAKANHGLLSHLRLSKKQDLPMPVQENISLLRFAEMGADDPELAWPIWRALMEELTAPSQPEKEGLQRHPVFVGLDGLGHAMTASSYLDVEARPVHAHDLALIRDFTRFLSGESPMPNGGMVLAATSSSDRPRGTDTLDHSLHLKQLVPHLQRLNNLRDTLIQSAAKAQHSNQVDLAELESTPASSFPEPLASKYATLRRKLVNLHDSNAPIEKLRDFLRDRFVPAIPDWDPYMAIDQKVVDALKAVSVQKVEGLTKDEARGVMEYYALSGVLRERVTEGLVSERWTLAGSGIVGRLEEGVVRARF